MEFWQNTQRDCLFFWAWSMYYILNLKRNVAQKYNSQFSLHLYNKLSIHVMIKFWCSGSLLLLNFLWWVPTPCVAIKTCNLKWRNNFFVFHILWNYQNCDISFAVQFISDIYPDLGKSLLKQCIANSHVLWVRHAHRLTINVCHLKILASGQWLVSEQRNNTYKNAEFSATKVCLIFFHSLFDWPNTHMIILVQYSCLIHHGYLQKINQFSAGKGDVVKIIHGVIMTADLYPTKSKRRYISF